MVRYAPLVNEALEILKRERDDAVDAIRALRGKIKDLNSAIAVLEGQPAVARKGRSGGDFKLSVLNKLKEFAPAGATPQDLADAMTRGGRPTKATSVSPALSRLKADAKVSNRNGQWFVTNLVTNAPAAAPNELPKSLNETSEWEDFDEDVPF